MKLCWAFRGRTGGLGGRQSGEEGEYPPFPRAEKGRLRGRETQREGGAPGLGRSPWALGVTQDHTSAPDSAQEGPLLMDFELQVVPSKTCVKHKRFRAVLRHQADA